MDRVLYVPVGEIQSFNYSDAGLLIVENISVFTLNLYPQRLPVTVFVTYVFAFNER